MHELIEKKIKDIESRIEEYKRIEDDLIFVLALLQGNDKYHVWIDYDVNISWKAKSIDEVKDLLKLFAKNGVMLENFYKESTYWRLRGRNVCIYLIPTWFDSAEEVEGVTCRRVQVDTKLVPTPVYKIICDGKEVTPDEMNS
ncbi:MAG: hypothetical protein WC554_04235 [Clostridia bacterium]